MQAEIGDEKVSVLDGKRDKKNHDEDCELLLEIFFVFMFRNQIVILIIVIKIIISRQERGSGKVVT